MYTVALKAMPYVTISMDFERCKDSVSASIVDDIPVSVTISLRVTGVNEFY